MHNIHLLNAGDITFVLTSGRHNAGIVTEPGHPHRSYHVLRRPPNAQHTGPEPWLGKAVRRDGSWWTEWANCPHQHSGASRPPPDFGAPGYQAMGDAPGQYVFEH